MRTLAALATIALLALSPATAGARVAADDDAGNVERIAGPLPRFFPHLDNYLELDDDQRSHFRLAYVVGSERGVPPGDIRMWYDYEGETRPFDIDGSGRITRLPGLAALEAAPDVWINQPASDGLGFTLTLQFEYGQPVATRYQRGDLARGIEQTNRAIRRAAGVASLFAPRMETVVFVFDDATPEAWAVDADGERTPLTVQENHAFFRPGDRANRSVDHLEFGREPRRVLFDS
jgi:hypothetical protein